MLFILLASFNPAHAIKKTWNGDETTIKRGHAVQLVNGTDGILHYYDISPANNSGLDATVRFTYLDSELNGIAEADLTLYRFNGSFWEEYTVSDSDLSANFVETIGVGSFSVWTLAAPGLAFLIIPIYSSNAFSAKQTTMFCTSIILDN